MNMNITVNKDDSMPLYRQIVRQFRDQILSGHMQPGFRLPPERELAAMLEVTRTTVKTAYDELKSQGLVDARVGRGTVVLAGQQTYPDVRASRTVVWSQYFNDQRLQPADPLARKLLDMSFRPDVISFGLGLPSPEHLPINAVAEIVNSLVSEVGPQILLQAPNEGIFQLRDTLRQWLSTRGIHCSVEEVFIVSGAELGIHLSAGIFLNPGDTVIVEAPTYFGALEVYRRSGVRVISVPVDEDGMQVETLPAILRRHRPKLIFVMPSFQNPSGTVMSLARRQQLLELAAAHGILILEDDAYSELRYEGEDLPSLKAMDTHGLVIHLGTLSKMLFSGLRIGWMVAPREVVRQFALLKQSVDCHSSTFGQFISDRMFRDGLVDAHLATVRDAYRKHRDVMDQALHSHSTDGLRWEKPQGGYYFWAELPGPVDRAQLATLAADEKVSFLPGHACFADEPSSCYLRLNFSYPTLKDIPEGIARLMRAVKNSQTDKKRDWDMRRISTRPIV